MEDCLSSSASRDSCTWNLVNNMAVNDLILPMIAVSTTKAAYTIQLCLLDFQGEYLAQEHYRLAMTVVSLIPTTLVFVFLQKYITTGIATSGIK